MSQVIVKVEHHGEQDVFRVFIPKTFVVHADDVAKAQIIFAEKGRLQAIKHIYNALRPCEGRLRSAVAIVDEVC